MKYGCIFFEMGLLIGLVCAATPAIAAQTATAIVGGGSMYWPVEARVSSQRRSMIRSNEGEDPAAVDGRALHTVFHGGSLASSELDDLQKKVTTHDISTEPGATARVLLAMHRLREEPTARITELEPVTADLLKVREAYDRHHSLGMYARLSLAVATAHSKEHKTLITPVLSDLEDYARVHLVAGKKNTEIGDAVAACIRLLIARGLITSEKIRSFKSWQLKNGDGKTDEVARGLCAIKPGIRPAHD